MPSREDGLLVVIVDLYDTLRSISPLNGSESDQCSECSITVQEQIAMDEREGPKDCKAAVGYCLGHVFTVKFVYILVSLTTFLRHMNAQQPRDRRDSAAWK